MTPAKPPQTNSSLIEKTHALEALLSTITDFAYLFDIEGRFRFVNQPLLDLWGLTLEQAIGKNFFELRYPLDLAAKLQREIQQVIDTKTVFVGETQYTSATGIVGYYEYIFSPVLSPDGNVEAVAGTTREISDRKQAELAAQQIAERLERQSRLFEQIASSTLDFIYVFDLQGKFLYANRRLLEVWGVTYEQAIGKSLAELGYPAWHMEMHMREISQVIQTKRPIKGEIPFTGGSGISGVYEYIFTPVLNPDGQVEVIAGTTRNITDRKFAETERERLLISERVARGEAERASRTKDEFLATLSHELRTPLNAILGWATILKNADGNKEDVIEGITVIERNARAQTQIIEDLLDMSRIINGKVRLQVQRTDLAEVLRAASDTVRPAADAKGVRLHAVLHPDAASVSGDPNRLQQIFWNLLSNAVKFTPRGGQVQVLLQRVDSHIEVTVADTGEGISPEFLPQVFDRFRQADASTTRRHGGLGLGLAIVRQLVELHGGTVRAESRGVGRGSTFTVGLPLNALHIDPATIDASRRLASAVPASSTEVEVFPKLAGVNVLVVDDELDARVVIKRLLEDCGAAVRVAGSVDEAISLIRAEQPNVLISDIGMPGEDGYSLIRRVRALDPSQGRDVSAVALTAYARTEDRVRALSTGFQTHVAKPVDPGELIAVVASLAGRSGR